MVILKKYKKVQNVLKNIPIYYANKNMRASNFGVIFKSGDKFIQVFLYGQKVKQEELKFTSPFFVIDFTFFFSIAQLNILQSAKMR